MSKSVVVLGSTGSIGKNALAVCKAHGFSVVGIAANSSIDELEKQIKEHSPKYVAVADPRAAAELERRVTGCVVLSGNEGIEMLAALPDVDVVVAAIVGASGVSPVYIAAKSGKRIALANKEALVAAGSLIMRVAKENGAEILPVDSEHSALFQCLLGETISEIDSLVVTASGGPFRTYTDLQLQHVTVEDALAHPTWKMGAKISVDSSTLMNKGLEVIEAYHLFGLPLSQIHVVVHPQSIIHGIANFVDGSSKAQLSVNDMKLPIQLALTYPKRVRGLVKPLDFASLGSLTFEKPNETRFPCLSIAKKSLELGETAPCFMNAANEALVAAFLEKKIGWQEIGKRLQTLMDTYTPEKIEGIEHLLSVDTEARKVALQ